MTGGERRTLTLRMAAALDYATLASQAEPKVIHDEKLNEKFIARLEEEGNSRQAAGPGRNI